MRGPCPVCEESADFEVKRPYRATHPIFEGLDLLQCRQCGMVFADSMPCEEALTDYNASYFTSAHGGQPQNYQAKAFFSGIARLRMAHVERFLCSRNIAVTSVLEFGPGSGFFSLNWLAKHPQTSYSAYETDTSCHFALQKMGVHLYNVSTQADGTDIVDLIVMSHVMEHVTDPKKFLMESTRNLRRGGAIFIEVPCRDWAHKPIDEPHLLFFEKGPMHLLLKRAGFEDIQVSYHGQEIERLSSASLWRSISMTLRSKLIALGLIVPFARKRPGMEVVTDPLERAVVAPFQAHREMKKPAWWLRAVARKR
ncbi:putative Methyltransferase domain protein [uncultured Woeseiaceae bacterium]|uniref:Putative Methyltransferase domain protein n=1 Tax=uncultured Woeseiaceae bacterium TaxID=1983305 RepID=A0A7D9D0Z9_9GAMM|nr:putative Methyltransferase domain protein [uncultured Woeseiaceae bacterium]